MWVKYSAINEQMHMEKEMAKDLSEEIEKAKIPSLHLSLHQFETQIQSATASIKLLSGWLYFIGI